MLSSTIPQPNSHSRPTSFSVFYYAGAATFLGVLGFFWGDFAGDWQHVGPHVAFRGILAYAAATMQLVGGFGLLFKSTARASAFLLVLVYSVFALIWVPEIFHNPSDYGNCGNFFEELSAVLGAAVLSATLSPHESRWARWTPRLCRLYGMCVVSFMLVHIYGFPFIGPFIPAWIPLGQTFWAVATTIFFGMAAVSILTGILDVLASRLLAIMIIVFEFCCWVPRAMAAPHDHFNWSGNAICILLAAASWVIADTISLLRHRAAVPVASGT